MKIVTEPSTSLPGLSEDLQLVIRIAEDEAPEVFLQEGSPKPDRHMLLGIVQSVTVAVEEKDPDIVRFVRPCAIRLERDGDTRVFDSGLVIARSDGGAIAALVMVDPQAGRRLARQALRWFTGTIRLDVP